MSANYYHVLGITDDANAAEITQAYRKLAMKYHPDVYHGQDQKQRWQELQEAYDILKNPDKKHRYDALLNRDMPQDLLQRVRAKGRQQFQNQQQQYPNQQTNQRQYNQAYNSNGVPNIPPYGNFAPLFSYLYHKQG